MDWINQEVQARDLLRTARNTLQNAVDNEEKRIEQSLEDLLAPRNLQASMLLHERNRVLKELRSALVKKAGEGSAAVRSFDAAAARTTTMSTRSVLGHSLDYRNL